MTPDPETIPDHAPSETEPPSRTRRPGGRASMRPEFLALFRDTRLPEPLAPTDRPEHAVPPSRYLRRYLLQSGAMPDPARSGLVTLDAVLGGGFATGLHLVVGPHTLAIAFLESLLWEAVARKHSVVYYPLTSSSLEVWKRLMTTLGTILDEPAVTSGALQGGELPPGDRETLARLDAELQRWVLPYLSLVDALCSPPICPTSLANFVDGIRLRLDQAAETHEGPGLVLIDDMQTLSASTGPLPLPQLLEQFDESLRGDSVPCVLIVGEKGLRDTDITRLPVQTVLRLSDGRPTSDARRVDLEVRRNAAGEWIGTIPLVLDRTSGFFAEASAG